MNKILMTLFCFGVLVAFTAGAPNRRVKRAYYYYPHGLYGYFRYSYYPYYGYNYYRYFYATQDETQQAQFCKELKMKLDAGIQMAAEVEAPAEGNENSKVKDGIDDMIDSIGECKIEIPGVTDKEGQLLQKEEEKNEEE